MPSSRDIAFIFPEYILIEAPSIASKLLKIVIFGPFNDSFFPIII